MKILVIGGTRFMGPRVVRRLLERGHEVAVFNRGQSPVTLPDEVRHIAGDRRDLLASAGALRRFGPDVVVDMFCMTEADARAAMDLFARMSQRLVVISSADVYRAFGRLIGFEPGEPEPMPLTEVSPLRDRRYPYRGESRPAADDPRWWTYDYDKILVEQAVLGHGGLPGTVLRLPMVYGPSDGQHRFFSYIQRMDDGRPAIPLEASLAGWRGQRGYVENVAEAIALAASDDRAAGRVYNVGDPDTPAEIDWVRALAEATGWQGEIATVPDGALGQGPLGGTARQDLAMDTQRIRAELGYVEVVGRDRALRETVAWERANPPTAINPAMFDYAAEDAVLASRGARRD